MEYTERELELLKEARRTYKSINMKIPAWIFMVERQIRLEQETN